MTPKNRKTADKPKYKFAKLAIALFLIYYKFATLASQAKEEGSTPLSCSKEKHDTING